MFTGFSDATIDFLWELRFHNERPWFLEHKQVFLDTLDRPMKALADEVYGAFTDRHPDLDLICKVSRIYRDARRLFGRGPYKDHLWFTIRPEQEGWTHVPAFYFEIAPEYHSLGMGYYGAEPVTMAKFRSRIDRDRAPMEKLAGRLSRQLLFVV